MFIHSSAFDRGAGWFPLHSREYEPSAEERKMLEQRDSLPLTSIDSSYGELPATYSGATLRLRYSVVVHVAASEHTADS